MISNTKYVKKKLWKHIKNYILAFAFLLGTVCIALTIRYQIKNVIDLKNYGRETYAKVLRVDKIPKSLMPIQKYYYEISYDSHKAKFESSQKYDLLSSLYVVYLPNKPDVINIGGKANFKQMYFEIILVSLVLLLFLTCLWYYISKTIKGRFP